MNSGYMGKLLYVDLNLAKLNEEKLEEDFCKKFLGGYGMGAKILFDRMTPGIDPLGADNILGFLTGPLTGTPALIGSRYVVVCKSPLTLTWGDANSGGYFGPALKFAGYDGVIFTGASDNPVYLFIEEGKAELRDATDLWGKDSHDTDDMLKERHGKDVRIACIGPAGEAQSLLACVMNDTGRAAGRSGVGAVMGSKKLKAIVVKGHLEVPMADPAKAKELRRKHIKELQGPGDIFSKYGTAGITAGAAISGDSPVKNWAGSGTVDFPNADPISDESVLAMQEKKFACWQCPIACGGLMKEVKGKYAMPAGGHKPEYETLSAFGSLMLNNNLESIIKANDICNRAGLDTISVGVAVTFAIECYENGILTKDDTGGLELKWGNVESIVALTEQVAKRTGLGELLADGVKRASEKIGKGSEAYAIHVGGQEVPMHDPKFTPGLAMTYQLDATPGRHTQGGELIAPPAGLDFGSYDRKVYSGRAEDQKKLVSLMHVVNASGLCMFGYISYDASILPEFFQAITGWDVDMDDLIKIGERIANVRQMFNIREGITPLKWKISGRLFGHPPLEEGNISGVELDEKTMAQEYLQAMGWDAETMIPAESKLKELGLEDMRML